MGIKARNSAQFLEAEPPEIDATDQVDMPYPETSKFGRHFQGATCHTPNPGLKPWAESYCPFGA